MKKTCIVLIIVMLAALAVSGCGGNAEEEFGGQGLPLITCMAGEDVLEEVMGTLEEAGLGNVDSVRNRVSEFNELAGPDCGLAAGWVSPGELSVDVTKTMDGWENNRDYSDANCRITAFTLLGDKVEVGNPVSDYDGTYLMFDLDAVDNAEEYASVRENRSGFISLYGEFPLGKDQDLGEAYLSMIKERGIRFPEGKARLINVVIADPDFGVAFIGHTGVVCDTGKGYLYFEKVAFEQQYNAIRADSLEDIAEILAARPGYYGEEGTQGPLIYCGEELIKDCSSR